MEGGGVCPPGALYGNMKKLAWTASTAQVPQISHGVNSN